MSGVENSYFVITSRYGEINVMKPRVKLVYFKTDMLFVLSDCHRYRVVALCGGSIGLRSIVTYSLFYFKS